MKTRAEKALHLCREYDRLMSSIAKLKNDIGDGLGHCERYVTGPNGDYITDGKATHLSEAFEFRFDDDQDDRVYNSEKEQLEIIDDCSGCLKAWKAVRDRKAARKALGIVKRQIRMIGRGTTDEKA